MKQILIIHLNDENNSEVVHFLDQEVQIQRKGCGGDPEIARALIAGEVKEHATLTFRVKNDELELQA